MKNYLMNMMLLVMSLSLVGCIGEFGEDSAANTTTKTSTNPPVDAPPPPPVDAPPPPSVDAPPPPPVDAPPPPPVDVPISGSTSLSWTAPVTRTDDSSLLSMAEIAGYRIYMGSSAANFALLTDIANVHITEYKINNLGEGTYYFAVSTYSIENIESDVSQIVSKTI